MFKIILISCLFAFTHYAFAQDSSGDSRGEYFVNPLGLLNLTIGEVYKPNSGNSKDHSGQSIFLQGGRNFTNFEIGGTLSYSNFDYSSGNTESGYSLGILGQYNFIANIKSNKFVPYILGDVQTRQNKIVGSNEDTIKGMYYAAEVGTLYYPWNDVIALAPGLRYSLRKYEADGNNNYEYSGFNLLVNFKLYF